MQIPSANTGWGMRQTGSKLLFAHWPVKPDVLRPLIPPGLILDTFEGEAWVGVVPFYMSQVRFRYAPPFPTTTEFCELNVRTYVMPKGGKPGVWFFSLDASSQLAVRGARVAFPSALLQCVGMRLTTHSTIKIHYFLPPQRSVAHKPPPLRDIISRPALFITLKAGTTGTVVDRALLPVCQRIIAAEPVSRRYSPRSVAAATGPRRFTIEHHGTSLWYYAARYRPAFTLCRPFTCSRVVPETYISFLTYSITKLEHGLRKIHKFTTCYFMHNDMNFVIRSLRVPYPLCLNATICSPLYRLLP